MHHIDQMIFSLKEREKKKNEEGRMVVEARRDAAYQRLGEAAKKWDIGDILLQRRLEEAFSVRISHAEALACLADEVGDFESTIMWWKITSLDKESEIGNRKTEESIKLWEGYTLVNRAFRLQFVECGREFDFNSRYICDGGGYVASCYVHGGAISVGLSVGDGATPKCAAYNSALAYYRSYSDSDKLPHGLEQALTDFKMAGTDN
jgi:hypothetical protein